MVLSTGFGYTWIVGTADLLSALDKSTLKTIVWNPSIDVPSFLLTDKDASFPLLTLILTTSDNANVSWDLSALIPIIPSTANVENVVAHTIKAEKSNFFIHIIYSRVFYTTAKI